MLAIVVDERLLPVAVVDVSRTQRERVFRRDVLEPHLNREAIFNWTSVARKHLILIVESC